MTDINAAIIKVMKEVGYVQKQKGKNLNYSYAGEAALIEAIRPAMLEAGISMRVVDISVDSSWTYITKSGTNMNAIRIVSSVQFAHAESETSVTVKAMGEGSDVGDKAANKAQTGAYKYALRQTFCIETGDDPDKTPSDTQEKATTSASVEWDLATLENVLKSHPTLQHTKHVKAMLLQDGVNVKPGAAFKVVDKWVGHYLTQRDLTDDRKHCISEANKTVKE